MIFSNAWMALNLAVFLFFVSTFTRLATMMTKYDLMWSIGDTYLDQLQHTHNLCFKTLVCIRYIINITCSYLTIASRYYNWDRQNMSDGIILLYGIHLRFCYYVCDWSTACIARALTFLLFFCNIASITGVKEKPMLFIFGTDVSRLVKHPFCLKVRGDWGCDSTGKLIIIYYLWLFITCDLTHL